MALARRNRLPAKALQERFRTIAVGPHLRLLARSTPDPVWRGAIRVPSRAAKRAVERNHIRRVLSEAMIVLFEKRKLTGVDVILSVHTPVDSVGALRNECATLIGRL